MMLAWFLSRSTLRCARSTVGAIHAGLECGLFAGKIPGLDSVSFGPDLSDVHTCHERLHIASTQRTWKLLCEVLRRMK